MCGIYMTLYMHIWCTLIHREFTRLGQQHSKDNKKKLGQLWVDAVHLREREREREGKKEGQ
jgi:hypothetical protein